MPYCAGCDTWLSRVPYRDGFDRPLCAECADDDPDATRNRGRRGY